MRLKIFPGMILVVLSMWPGFSMAQVIPAGVDVGAQGQRFQADSKRQRKAYEGQNKKTSAGETGGEKRQALPTSLKFTLTSVNITGVTLLKPQQFTPLYQSLIGKEISLADIQTVADAIRSQYKARQYLTTTVVVPEQEIKNGVVEILVIEGRMGKLKVEGNKHFPLQSVVNAFHIKEGDLLNFRQMLTDILRLNQSSDLQGRTVISAGEKLGTSDITLKVHDRSPWHVGMSEDNAGTRLTGKYRTGFTVRSTNATGQLDTLFLSTSLSRYSFGQSASYRIPVGNGSTKLGFDATYFRMRIGREYYPQGIKGTSQIYTPQVIQELWFDDRSQGSAILGMDVKSIYKTALNVKTADDQLRIPFLALDISEEDAYGQMIFNPRVNVSTEDFLGASERGHLSASRPGTDGKFVKYEQGFSRIQRMPLDTYATLRIDVQVASRTLPSSDQIQLGGMNSVRGYPEGDFMADSGGFVNVDWFVPVLPQPWHNQIIPVVFMDYGTGHVKTVNPGESYRKDLLGVGGGLRLRLNQSAMIRLEWAKDMKDEPVSGSGPSVFYVQCQAEF